MLFARYKNEYERYEFEKRKEHFSYLLHQDFKNKIKNFNRATKSWFKKRLENFKKNNFFASLNYEAFKIDFTRLLGRSYYIILFILALILDITVLIKIFLNFNYIFLTIPLTIFSVYSYISFARNMAMIALNKTYTESLIEQPRAQCSSGAPGAGKTSNEAYKTVVLAKQQWKILQEEYFYYCNVKRDNLSKSEQDHYDEVVQAYNFEMNSKNKIHCLWSVIEIKDANNPNIKSHSLTKAHLLQKVRLPYRAVLFVDEIGSLFPATKGKSEPEIEKLSIFARWIRHFLEAFLTFTEQDFLKTFIDVRRVTGSVKYFEQQKWVLKPRFLLWLYKCIFSLVTFPFVMMKYYKQDTKRYAKQQKKLKRRCKLFRRPLKWLRKLISCIGFRHYIYEEQARETGGKREENNNKNVRRDIHHIYLPSPLNCKYDDRAFKNAYEPIEQELVECEFSGGKLSKMEIERLFNGDTSVQNCD